MEIPAGYCLPNVCEYQLEAALRINQELLVFEHQFSQSIDGRPSIHPSQCVGRWRSLRVTPGHRVDGEGYWVVCGTVQLSVDHLLDKSNGVIHHPVDLHTHTHINLSSIHAFTESVKPTCSVPVGCIAGCRHPELDCEPVPWLRSGGFTTWLYTMNSFTLTDLTVCRS